MSSFKTHLFRTETSSEVYDETQVRDEIKSGDTLIVQSERIVGLMYEAWPVTESHGLFHQKDPAYSGWNGFMISAADHAGQP
jgi:hypothetical protein